MNSSNQDGSNQAQNLEQFLKDCLERGKERQRIWRESCLDIASWTFSGTDGLLRFQLQCGLETARLRIAKVLRKLEFPRELRESTIICSAVAKT